MKVILLGDVKDVGHADTVVNVSDGFARNFLFPQKLAVDATPAAIASLEQRVKDKQAKLAQERAALKAIASKLNNAEIEIHVDAGENGKLFGSVTNADIAKKIHEKLGLDIDKKRIVIDEPIKATGAFKVHVKFALDISASVRLNVSSSQK
jgi:large subunit ribosomal protein L9